MKNAMKNKKHWYITFITECPVCGRGHKWRERVYAKPVESIVYKEVYDWCDV
jgi:hypothetical protein